MSESVRLPDPYRIKDGDTLGSIARQSGQSVDALVRRNGLSNPNRIAVGQVIYLSDASAYGVSVSFLDALRHPIANLPYRLQFDGRTLTGKTDASGLITRQITQSAQSTVEVWIEDAQRNWQQLVRTASGYGHKLITLVSDSLVIPAKVEPHPAKTPPASKAAAAKTATATQQAKPPKTPSGAPSKNNRAVKTKRSTGPKGQPIVVVGVEIPKGLLDYFASFKGGDIADADWAQSAAGLDCDVNVLKAFAKVESGGRNSFWRLNNGEGAHLPAILYERHYFSRLTKGVHDKEHPDVSWPTGYRTRKQLGKDDKRMHDERVDADDVYSDYASSYLRLIRAYDLDPTAALKSCSWGKFQIMGDNCSLCGEDDIKPFITKMCTSEHAQVALIAEFIRNKPRAWKNPKNKSLGKEISLWDAVKTRNWRAIAFNYNGPSYETYSYHTKLEQAYETFKKGS